MAGEILRPEAGQALVLADSEHFTAELLDRVKTETNFELLVPIPKRSGLRARLRALPAEDEPETDRRMPARSTPRRADRPRIPWLSGSQLVFGFR